jgi:hypothetical protein
VRPLQLGQPQPQPCIAGLIGIWLFSRALCCSQQWGVMHMGQCVGSLCVASSALLVPWRSCHGVHHLCACSA